MEKHSQGMPKTAVAFALRHRLPLGRREDGHFTLRSSVTLKVTHLSMFPTAASAVVMMRRALREVA